MGRPSLESLVESEDLGFEVLHPGGLKLTQELAELCHIGRGRRVLDVASGTGESACFLVERFGSEVVGVDASDLMVERARGKVRERGLQATFLRADAHRLPFGDGAFDAVISECTLCLLDKERALGEMVRVARSGGYVGIHDVCWKESAPDALKRKLAELEGERPETLEGWKRLFKRAELEEVVAIDRSSLLRSWEGEIKRQLGVAGQIRIFLKAIRHWGLAGYRAIRASEGIFQSEHVGYGIVVGRKP
jgi:SAM-dependent methyltransferase